MRVCPSAQQPLELSSASCPFHKESWFAKVADLKLQERVEGLRGAGHYSDWCEDPRGTEMAAIRSLRAYLRSYIRSFILAHFDVDLGPKWKPQMPHQVRSGPSSQSTFVQFKNNTDVVVSVSWIDYEGKEVPYEKIQPGKYYRQQTFVGHPWSFRTYATREQLVVDRRVLFVPVQSSTDFVASIQHPAAITWSPCKHDAFPEDFHAAVQALLLCHGAQGKLQSLEEPLPGSLKRKGSGLSNLLNKRNPLQTSSSNLRSQQPQKTMLSSLPHDLVLDIIRRSAPVVLDIEDL